MMKEKTHILIVENESIVAENIKSRLTKLGYTVSAVVYNGRDAINAVKETYPEIILMDIKLENGMDGIESAREIRSQFDIPVIYLTAYADEETVKRAKITEPFGYILKPFKTSELLTAIEIALYRHDMEKKLQESEEKYRIFFKAARNCTFITTKDGKWLDFSDIAVKFFGYNNRDELEKIRVSKFFKNQEDVVKLTKLIEEFEYVEDYEVDLKKKDNSIINALFTATARKDTRGNIIGFHGSIKDVTSWRNMEENLRNTTEALKKTIDGIIQAISMTVETRDPYTAGHQRRVADLAYAIAHEMNLPEEKAEGVRMAGVIHDIGKIHIPAEILSKPGVLTEIERDLIKTHPKAGYDIIKSIEFPFPICEIVLQHHEMLDGSGYPYGLKGDSIIPEARIITVADVVEAMASHRPYRPALGIEVALGEIEKNAGILYDEKVVGGCLRLFKEKGFKFE